MNDHNHVKCLSANLIRFDPRTFIFVKEKVFLIRKQ